jgi:hypothetical protein
MHSVNKRYSIHQLANNPSKLPKSRMPSLPEYGILRMIVVDYMGVEIDTPEDLEKGRLL